MSLNHIYAELELLRKALKAAQTPDDLLVLVICQEYDAPEVYVADAATTPNAADLVGLSDHCLSDPDADVFAEGFGDVLRAFGIADNPDDFSVDSTFTVLRVPLSTPIQ